jgi:hypothetical protein
MTLAETVAFAAMLRSVARDLILMSDAIENGREPTAYDPSTYALEAQGAVYDQMVQDRIISSTLERRPA